MQSLGIVAMSGKIRKRSRQLRQLEEAGGGMADVSQSSPKFWVPGDAAMAA